MCRPLASVPLLGLLLATACSPAEGPPGEPIGTFAFVATLEPSTEAGRCTFAGAPARISFDGSISRDPVTNEAWLQIDGTLREGTLDGSTFTLGLPEQPDGSTRLVPRHLDACTCDLGFDEDLAGYLVPRLEEGCATPPAEEPPGADTCPRIDEGGELAWDTCGGACGTLTESVRPASSICTCTVDGAEVPAPSQCTFVYRFEARRIGG